MYQLVTLDYRFFRIDPEEVINEASKIFRVDIYL